MHAFYGSLFKTNANRHYCEQNGVFFIIIFCNYRLHFAHLIKVVLSHILVVVKYYLCACVRVCVCAGVRVCGCAGVRVCVRACVLSPGAMSLYWAGPSFRTFLTWRNSSGRSPPMMVKPKPPGLFLRAACSRVPRRAPGSRVNPPPHTHSAGGR